MRHTVVLSDIHLCELEPEAGLWMRYRQEPASPNRELAAMVDKLRGEVAGDELELVFNGDIFDFDAPRVVDDYSVFHDQPRDAAHTVPMIAAILEDHALFIEALGRLVADGHAVVFVSGNHDLALGLPEVREVLTARIVGSVSNSGSSGASRSGELCRRVSYRAWFHLTSDRILIEHGNQYDGYCSVRYPMAPFVPGKREIQPTLGSLAARHLVSRMGYFNPNVERSYMLSGLGYLAHWARYYLFSRHSIAVAWFVGALRSFAVLCASHDPSSPERREADLRAAALETGASIHAIARHARFFAKPAGDALARAARELWLDRLAVVLLALAVGVVLAALVGAPALVGAALAPIALLVYQLAIPKAPLETNWRRVRRAARAVARVHGARAVVFGHTHTAEASWERGVFFGNTGSWSAAYADLECTKLLEDQRPVVWLRSTDERGGDLAGGLVAWRGGEFCEYSRDAADAPRRATAGRGDRTAPTPVCVPSPRFI